MRLPLHLGSVSTGCPGSTCLGTWWIVMSAHSLGMLEPGCLLCLSLPSPPSPPLDPPVWRNVPTRVETGPGARDATYWKHPGVSPIIHVAVGWAESVSPGLPRWQHTGSSGHCWFLSWLWFFSISNVDSDILFSKWGKWAASQQMGLSYALDTKACRRHLPVTSLHSHIQP